jgi:uncharacterized membrane protein YfcA
MNILSYLALGLVIGSVSGALGIGGGVLLVPALMLCGFAYSRATGTSLAVLVPPIGLLAAWKSYQQGRVDIDAAIVIAVAFAIGAYGGAWSVAYIPQELLRFLFGLLMIYIAMRFIVESDKEARNAAAGLVAMLIALCVYWGLRKLGRRHRLRPDLGQAIRQMGERRDESDYHI